MPVHILACRMLEMELEAVLSQFREEKPFGNVQIKVTYLDVGLHCFLDKLKNEITSALEEIRSGGDDKIILLYGSMCHPQFNEFLPKSGLITFPERSCIQLIMPEQTSELTKEFFLTSGWLKYWDEMYESAFGGDKYYALQSYGYYDQMVFGDTHVCDISDEEILHVFETTGVPIDTINVPLEHFADKIRNAITKAVSLKDFT